MNEIPPFNCFYQMTFECYEYSFAAISCRPNRNFFANQFAKVLRNQPKVIRSDPKILQISWIQ